MAKNIKGKTIIDSSIPPSLREIIIRGTRPNLTYAERYKDDMKPTVDFTSSIELEDYDYEDTDYVSQTHTEEISFIELAIINDYLYNCYMGKNKEIRVLTYGQVDNIGQISYGGAFDITSQFWFNAKIGKQDNDFIFQTKTYVDSRNELVSRFHITLKKGISGGKFEELFNKIRSLAFNNSQYKGKCIKVKLREGRFRGIEIIKIEESANELILNNLQKKYIEHFIKRVGKGGHARYLFNGPPGCGKTETIREIMRRLMPKVTFIIPDFSKSEDLTTIMESCEIFDSGVIIMDDIDLYLGSRDNGSYTRLLGEFLAFFDGVKRRKISIIGSTNSKALVDSASSRPGRFNLILDYGYLNNEQIVKVCQTHLEKRWHIQDVYDVLTNRIDGKPSKITGAFIANLADNIREMSDGDKKWSVKDTISLIEESYRGFYLSQSEPEKKSMGFGN